MRNPSSSNIKCKIVGRNLVNGLEKEYAIRDGAVFVDNKNEELDSGTIVIPQVDEEIEIEPYDEIIVSCTKINNRDMLVDTYTCTQTCINPAKYSYEITLMSKTKLLEGMLCPSLAITRVESSPRSIYDYINQYMNEYCTKTDSDTLVGAKTNLITLDSSIYNKFNSVECPEMQWNEPTLREVLTDLMMVKDCIPVIKGNKLYYMDLSTSGGNVETNPTIMKCINYITFQQSSSDYVSEIKSPLVNAVAKNQTCKICERITFRNYDTYILTTDNVRVETANPISNLLGCTIRAKFKIGIYIDSLDSPGSPSYETQEVEVGDDLMQYILEYNEWQTKPIYYAGMDSNTQPSTNYQNTCLYWKRLAKGIHNFEGKTEGQFLWVSYSKAVLELILNKIMKSNATINYAINKYKQENPAYADPNHWAIGSAPGNSSYDWKTCQFELQYETISNHVLFASKGGISRNKRQIVDNQTNSYVNANSHGLLEYAKANRLGNKIKIINGRFGVMTTTPVYALYEESDIPGVGNKFGNYIIFKKEMAVYGNYIKVNYYATENYVLKNYFTGIKSKARSWKIVDGNEAFIRADNIKLYINPNEMSDVERMDGFKVPVYNTLNDYYSRLKYCYVKFKKPNDVIYYPIDTDMKYKGTNYDVTYYMMEFQKVICGNSLLLTIRCLDNAIVGKYVNNNNQDIGSGVRAMTQLNCKYVDDNGENDGGYIYFAQTYSLDNAINDTYREAYENLYPGTDAYCMGTPIMRIPFKFHKDNKEITQITIQIELNEDANDMFLGKK